MRILILILSCLPCWAQFASISDQPFVSALPTSGYTDPSGANALYEWWVSTDLPLNVGLNTNVWTGRIASKRITSLSSVTNSSLGVYLFSETQSSLTNTDVVTPGTNQTICLIVYPISFSGATKGLWSPWNYSDGTQGNAATHGGITFHTDGTIYWGTAFTGGPQMGSAVLTVSNTYDFTLVQSNATIYFYTNAVLAKTFAQTPPAGGYSWKYMGLDNFSAAHSYLGYIKQVLVWSNNLSFLQVSNVHYYRTNLYGP